MSRVIYECVTSHMIGSRDTYVQDVRVPISWATMIESCHTRMSRAMDESVTSYMDESRDTYAQDSRLRISWAT